MFAVFSAIVAVVVILGLLGLIIYDGLTNPHSLAPAILVMGLVLATFITVLNGLATISLWLGLP